MDVKTPQNKRQLLEILRLQNAGRQPTRQERYLQQKIANAFDETLFQNALQTKQLDAQGVRLDEAKVRERKQKLVEDPNNRLVQIINLKKTNIQADKIIHPELELGVVVDHYAVFSAQRGEHPSDKNTVICRRLLQIRGRYDNVRGYFSIISMSPTPCVLTDHI